MKENITTGKSAANEREKVTFSLPLYQLTDFSNDSLHSTFPCEGMYVAELPDKSLWLVEITNHKECAANWLTLPTSFAIERAVGATKSHLLDAYIRDMADEISVMETKLDVLSNLHETLLDTVKENFKMVHLNRDEDSTDYRDRLESARRELKDAVDYLCKVLSVSSNNKGGISEQGLIRIIDSVRK